MSTAANPGHGAPSVPDELVVDRPYENEVVARLADLKLDHDVSARSRELDLSRVCVHGLEAAAGTLRAEADRLAASPGSEPWRTVFPRPTDQASPLDLLLYYIRFRTAESNAGWVFEMGKNRHVRSVIGLPHLSGGGVLYPVPVPAPKARGGRQAEETCQVGLLDTRIFPHPVLAGRYHAAEDATLPEGGPFPHWAGHATFVAGRILAEAPEARLVVRAVLNDEQAAATAWETALQMVAFRDSGVKILNLSLGCHTADGVAPLIISRAVELLTPEMVVVAAAGNHGDPKLNGPDSQIDQRASCWPGALAQVEAVGADNDKQPPELATFSPQVRWTAFNAPGENVVGPYLRGPVAVHTRDQGVVKADFPDGWARWSGTSFAAATVTGRLARMTARNGGDPHRALRDLRRELSAAGGSDPIRLAH
jgi:membrane-anchored mycosin MYCP